jgi:hypothetical protein
MSARGARDASGQPEGQTRATWVISFSLVTRSPRSEPFIRARTRGSRALTRGKPGIDLLAAFDNCLITIERLASFVSRVYSNTER